MLNFVNLQEKNYQILGRINYSNDIPIAMSHAQPVVIENPESEASKAIIQIFNNLKEKTNNLKK